ncbi:MAG: DNA primase [Holosporales bacterium]|jgi:DNA primase|nr:DNA primase [Holosporales bacterium]
MNDTFDRAKQDILARTSLVELIGLDVRLQKRGGHYVGLCPFHQEKTPSFTVDERNGFYHCFGCGAHGDAFSYVINKQNISFKEALALLADKAGVQLPAFSSRSASPKQQLRKTQADEAKQLLIDVHRLAAEYFNVTLRNGPKAAVARQYLQKRQVNEQTIEQFKLGYGDGGLTKYLISMSYSEETLLKAGVSLRDDKTQQLRDRFLHRLMFPIFDIKNRPIAFGGRTLDDNNPNIPKYLNSQETDIYHKGHNLYNLHNAIKHAREKGLVLVEGYMDVIAMVSHGFEQSVAALGTALTETQILTLWKYCERPTLCFDGDAAGVRASVRVVRRVLPLLKPGNTLFFCYLPQNLDPDELLKSQGDAAMQQHLEQTRSLVDVLWQDIVAVYERKNLGRESWVPEDKAALKRDITNIVTLITDAEVQASYKQALLDKFAAMQRRPVRNTRPLAAAQLSPHSKPQKIVGQKILLGIVLKRPGLLADVYELLSMVDFVDAKLSDIKNWLLDCNANNTFIEDKQNQAQCDAYLEGIGIPLLRVHAPFLFDDDVSSELVLKRWKEVWFCTEGYSMIKGDFKHLGNTLKQNFDEKLWEQMKALFFSVDYSDKKFD